MRLRRARDGHLRVRERVRAKADHRRADRGGVESARLRVVALNFERGVFVRQLQRVLCRREREVRCSGVRIEYKLYLVPASLVVNRGYPGGVRILVRS